MQISVNNSFNSVAMFVQICANNWFNSVAMYIPIEANNWFTSVLMFIPILVHSLWNFVPICVMNPTRLTVKFRTLAIRQYRTELKFTSI